LKLKLTGDVEQDIARVRAVRFARPGVWIGVDANQRYTIDALHALMGELTRAEVALLEQPLARGREADLEGFSSPIPIAADEAGSSARRDEERRVLSVALNVPSEDVEHIGSTSVPGLAPGAGRTRRPWSALLSEAKHRARQPARGAQKNGTHLG
jgi:hypothetical protein